MAIQTVYKAGLSYVVAIGASSVASTNPISTGVRVVRLVATSNCWVKFAPTPTADKTTSVYLPAGVPEYFQCAGNGVEKVAVIQDSAAGSLIITEMTQ